jgi:hypothetical protein
MRNALLTLALVALARPASAEVHSAFLALRSGYDVGSVAVPDTDSGLGLGASLRLALGDRGAWLLGLDADFAGYTGSADGDPILHLALVASRRWELGPAAGSKRLYTSLGGGVGVQGLASGGVVFPLRAALGLALFAQSGIGLDVALFERFTPVGSDGDPAWEFVNSLGLEIAVRFGRHGP